MAEVTLSTTVDLTLLKMKWKETYVSEGLNRKVVPSQPAGIYQGLRIIENLSTTRQIELSPDADTNFHMAVYQSTTGFSLTYWDRAGTAIVLDLSDAALDSTDVVIAMEVDYTIGAATTADWMAFPVTDYDALPASRKDELVILGTIAVPAPATNITTAMISFERTTMSWRNISKGLISWSPLVRNGEFEQSQEGGSNSWYWVLTGTAGAGTGVLRCELTDPSRGLYALELFGLTDGTVTYRATQQIAVPVVPGQLVMARLMKKNLLAAAGGTMSFNLIFAGDDGTDGTTISVDIDITGVDGDYVEVLELFEVPASQTMLSRIEITGVPNYASGAPNTRLYLDEVNVWLETEGERNDLQRGLSGDAVVQGSLSMREPGQGHGDPVFEATWDSAGSTLNLDDRVSSGSMTTALNGPVTAKQATLGAALLGAEADAHVPRIITVPSTFAGVEYTLINEAVPVGGKGYRRYFKADGTLAETYNCSWNNTTNQWTRDITSTRSTKIETNDLGMKFHVRDAGLGDTWVDTTAAGGWGAGGASEDSAYITPAHAAPSFDMALRVTRDGIGGTNASAAAMEMSTLKLEGMAEFAGSDKIIDGWEAGTWLPGISSPGIGAIHDRISSECRFIHVANKLMFVVVSLTWQANASSAVADLKISGVLGMSMSDYGGQDQIAALNGNYAATNDTPASGAFWNYDSSENAFFLLDGAGAGSTWSITSSTQYNVKFSMFWRLEI